MRVRESAPLGVHQGPHTQECVHPGAHPMAAHAKESASCSVHILEARVTPWSLRAQECV